MESLALLTVCIISDIFITMSPLLSKSNIRLPFQKTWIPYSIESSLVFWLTYFYQTFNSLTVGLLTSAVDIYVITKMQQISAQLEICKHRLHILPKLLKENNEKCNKREKESKILDDWIVYHKHIFA